MAYENLSTEAMNSLFITKIAAEEGRKEMEEAGTLYIRNKIREEAFVRKILPPIKVNKHSEVVQRSTTHDQLVAIVDIEPDSTAMEVTLVGQATVRYLNGARYEQKFFKIASERFKKSETELMSYSYNLKDVVTRNSIRDIEKVEDTRFTYYARAALNTSAKVIGTAIDWTNGGTKTTTIGGARTDGARINKTDLVALFNLIDSDEMKSNLLLMSITDYNEIMTWDNSELGFKTTDEITVNGYKYNKLLDRLLVVTNKTDIVIPGKIYCFTAPEFLGKFFTLQDIEFYINKVEDLLEFSSWEVVSMGIANTDAIGMLDLYTYNSSIPGTVTVLSTLNRGETLQVA